MSVTPEAHINALVVEVPELRPMLDERLHDFDGELLPHLFYADVMSWEQDQAFHCDATSSTSLKRLLDRLDADYRDGDEDLQGLMQVNTPRPSGDRRPVMFARNPRARVHSIFMVVQDDGTRRCHRSIPLPIEDDLTRHSTNVGDPARWNADPVHEPFFCVS